VIRPAALPLLFFASGALALVYEVLWQRRFALVFGGGATAAAAVLAAYFAGLGVGSYGLGRAAARVTRPLRVYAVLEALVALGALASFPLASAVEHLIVATPGVIGRAAPRAGLEVLVAFVALALPTFAMGGTLPVLARLSDVSDRRLGAGVGLLYAVNTAGAGLGALAVPFLVLPALGAKGGLLAAVGASVVVAMLAWTMDRPLSDAGGSPKETSSGPAATLSWGHPAVVLAAASGLATFVLQVLWNRAFAQVHENSTHSFALIVALFVLALALGAEISRIALRRGHAPEGVIGWAWLLAAALAATGPWLFVRLTHGLGYLPSDQGWVRDATRLAGIAAAVVLPAATAIGVAFPAVLEWAGAVRSTVAVTVVGRVLAANLTGCVLGALFAGFALPQAVGMWRSMLLAAAILGAGAAWCLTRVRAGGRGAAVAVAGAALIAAWIADPPRVQVAEASGERLVALSEGADGIVAVVERPGSRRLKLSNHYVLGGTGSVGDERMQAHLPLLLHPSPRRVALLGLGTGITAGGALFHPLDRLTAVELVPEVATSARVYLRDANRGVLDDARTRLVIGDARAYLRTTPDRFDVIVGDLAVPWRPGESALYTLESFAAARRTLAPGGLFCQWVPLFQLSEPELRIVLRTLLAVFPRAQVWRGDFSADEPALALVATAEPIALDPAIVETALRAAMPDPANAHLSDAAGVWLYFAGVLEPADLGTDDTRVNRDDRPWLELRGSGNGSAREPRCTGRRLQAWLADLRRRSEHRIDALGARERRAMEAGDWLFQLSLALSEHDDAAAQSAQDRVRALLPEATFRALFP
jgi:spermidine synthase